MATSETNLSVNIQDKIDSSSGILTWEIKEEDNEGSLDYVINKNFFARLYSSSDVEINKVVFTGGNIFLSGTGKISSEIGVDEVLSINFDGTNSFNLTYPYLGSLTQEIVGKIYDLNGNQVDSVFLSPFEKILFSESSIYGTFNISYLSNYDKYAFSSDSYGSFSIIAFGVCNGESINASISVTVSDISSEVFSSCGLNFEINDEDNDGSSEYKLGESYKVRLYKGEDIDSVTAFNTLGKISLSSSNETGTINEVISFDGTSESSLGYFFESAISYTPIGSFFGINGEKIGPPSVSFLENSLISDIPFFGSFEVSYKTSYDLYSFQFDLYGEAIIGATSICSGEQVHSSISISIEEEESSSNCCSSLSSNDSSEITTDVTLSFTDFVTGNAISGARVWVDGSDKGLTNDSGQITIYSIKTGIVHTVRASKVGYLSTESDSLSNDQFIINV